MIRALHRTEDDAKVQKRNPIKSLAPLTPQTQGKLIEFKSHIRQKSQHGKRDGVKGRKCRAIYSDGKQLPPKEYVC